MEENTYKIRKDKVKNIAIIFLSVMLVLTFFSNSILNHALPEVATAYVAYDTITERVRGTGTVTADDPYKVVAKDSRTIESVAITEGDMVTKDQVLFYLEDSESEELKEKEKEVKAKEDELSKEVLDYMTAILSVDISNAAYLNIESDNIASMAAYQAQIEASRQKVQSAQDTVDSLNRQILVAGMDSEDDIDREEDLAIATANMESASNRINAAQTQISEAESQISAAEATIAALDKKAAGESGEDGEGQAAQSLEVAALEAATELNEKKTAYTTAKTALETAFANAQVDFSAEGAPKKYNAGDYFDGSGMPKSVDVLTKLREVAETYKGIDSAKADNKDTAELFSNLTSAYDAYLLAKTAKESADKDLSEYKAAKNTLSVAKSSLASAQSALKNAQSEYAAYQDKVEDLTDDAAESTSDSKELQNSLNLSLEDAKAALADAQAQQEQLLKDISSELSLSSKNDDIADIEDELAELKEELEELRGEATDAAILSPVEGIIISVSKTAGESVTKEEEVALIQVAGKGMTVSFSVTNDQAAKVKVGDTAELQNAWYYTDVIVKLAKIKPDPDEPGKRKLLVFTVEGSVQNGESLSLSVGQRSAEYDFVVPNSAVREDKNGKFILIIEEKSTPFGNRYKAKRVDVEVMASDETKTAISADLQGYEYVITTSNQPLEAGDQVRLAAN